MTTLALPRRRVRSRRRQWRPKPPWWYACVLLLVLVGIVMWIHVADLLQGDGITCPVVGLAADVFYIVALWRPITTERFDGARFGRVVAIGFALAVLEVILGLAGAP